MSGATDLVVVKFETTGMAAMDCSGSVLKVGK